jgi:MerR family copper efflux transcriptional regulator
MNGLTLDKLAEQAGLEIDAVQFYEGLGLIKMLPESESIHHCYPQEEVSRLRFITRAQKLGFSLDEIKELLLLRTESHVTKKDIKIRTLIKIKDVENKLLDLLRIKGALEHLASTCEGHSSAYGCQILEALDPNTQERLGWRHGHQGN